MRRWLRRLGVALLALVAAVTLASLAYNLATRNRDTFVYRGPSVLDDGTRVAYSHWGTHGTPILLVGGFVEPSWVWSRVGPVLARTHRVYALDLPPFGYSERKGPYTLAHWRDLVRGFERRLHLVRPLVVGHSLGAAVAVAVATSSSGIVLLDGDALPVGGPGWAANLLVPPWFTSAYRIVTGSDRLFRRVLRNAGAPHVDGAVIDAWQRPFRVPKTAAAFRSMFRGGIQGVSRDALRAVRVPRLVVWGADDRVDSPAAGRRTAALLRTRMVVVPHAGHLSMLAAPAAVARTIDEFARRLRS